MRKLMLAAAALAFGLAAHAAQAQESVTIQLKWVTQAQFAGYYVAQEKGLARPDVGAGGSWLAMLMAALMSCPA